MKKRNMWKHSITCFTLTLFIVHLIWFELIDHYYFNYYYYNFVAFLQYFLEVDQYKAFLKHIVFIINCRC